MGVLGRIEAAHELLQFLPISDEGLVALVGAGYAFEIQILFHAARRNQRDLEIIDAAADTLGVEIDTDSVIRIARISDGFPHYVHFISEKLFWRVFGGRNEGIVTPELFGEAMLDASSSMDMRLKGPYETATQKYHGDYEEVLWAAADGHELLKRSSDIHKSYLRIMSLTRKKTSRKNSLQPKTQ
jgi:hypothetical protein